jgi:predicted transcriptional regulator
MAIIKAPPKQPKSVTVQARVEESVKEQLDQYAKFIDSTPSYVITEALKVPHRFLTAEEVRRLIAASNDAVFAIHRGLL